MKAGLRTATYNTDYEILDILMSKNKGQQSNKKNDKMNRITAETALQCKISFILKT